MTGKQLEVNWQAIGVVAAIIISITTLLLTQYQNNRQFSEIRHEQSVTYGEMKEKINSQGELLRQMADRTVLGSDSLDRRVAMLETNVERNTRDIMGLKDRERNRR